MYVLYLDESGNHKEASQYKMAGLAVFEREIHWFSQDLEALQIEYFPEEVEPIHFHTAQLRVPDGVPVEQPWDRLNAQKRRELKDKVYNIIRNRRGVLFGCAIEKRYAELRREDPYERAFEDLISRFDLFLRKINNMAVSEGGEEQRGIVVLAESRCANAIYGRYHSGLTGDFDRITPKFDQDGNILHGLAHLTTDYQCACVACFSRRGRQVGLT